MRRLLSIFFSAFFLSLCLLCSPVVQAEPIVWADKTFDFKTIHSIYLNDLDLTKVTLGSNVLEMNARDQLKESSKESKLEVFVDVPYTYQTDAIVTVSIDKFEPETVHYPERTSVVVMGSPYWCNRHWGFSGGVAIPVREPAVDINYQVVKLHCIVKDNTNNRTIYEYEEQKYVNMENPQKDLKKLFNTFFKKLKKLTH
ncbi:MAG: hypothetical protein K6C05_05935 [Anaerovibrio sp.]|uniref:hypothetical protein n=1 Tax=Anaerovibrio sp. TaxID=1872532 RepID=UPI0025D38D9C|nr:hypothetical protein [Anaerovibrio sp.]MCR5176375.1 hypothetical protein [Anaerovibrio sp.]